MHSEYLLDIVRTTCLAMFLSIIMFFEVMYGTTQYQHYVSNTRGFLIILDKV